MLEICFWGVRGSIASPGPDTALVGGNTSCVEVRCGTTRIVLDAGTGIRKLGETLAREHPEGSEIAVLLSHLHWDHIQGLPFFGPAYQRGTRLSVAGTANGTMTVRDALSHQMCAPVFPVRLEELGASLALRELHDRDELPIGEARVRVARLNHPGGVLAFRIDYDGSSVVYATDTEHYACVDPTLKQLAQGADVLIYDAQYTPDEYCGQTGSSRVGWGHSTYAAGTEIARAAGVGQLVLFHHDPRRTDAGVDEIERRARELFPETIAAREGAVIVVDRAGLAPRAA